ncbi:DPP10 [Bugula neritina]|uniref:DPP10 n=1 Tax=Bugula neritina TaxID=10212 RepID=A0A7J7IXS7_BUGNE|nr:DPP10 [Bugula neritina]
MNAAISTSKQGKGVSDGHDDHPVRASSKGIDPISLRTVTVDESFNRMEELVGSEEEEKNWKGIVIALVVIGVILGLIAMAIVLVTPRPEKYDPGKNLTFSSLINREIRPRTPVFKWIRGSDNFYTVYERYQLDTVDQLVRRYVTINDASVNETAGKSTFLSQDILSSTLRGAESFQVSPNLNYALTQIDSTTNSIFTNSIYKIYDRTKSSVIDIEGASTQLLYATWIGTNQELVYIKDNNIFYKESPEANTISVTSDGSTSILNGISNRLYKVFIFPDLESLIWPSPYDSKFVYAKIEESEVTSYSGSQLNSNTVERESALSSSEITVHLFDSGVSNQLQLPVTAGYLTSVSWMDEDRVIVVWLMTDHQSEKFFICNCKTKQCSLNFEYKSSKLGLSWVGMYGAPIYNHDREEYYTLLPDPANENKLYRHIAVIKVDETQRQEASQPFLTSHPWSDLKILKVDGDRLYYLSTGLNYTHQHLYSVSLDTKTSRCWTCKDLGLGNYTFVEAEFSWSNSYIYLSILGPDMPSYYVVDATDLTIGKNISSSAQVDREHYEALQVYYDGVYLPITEYVTFKLDNNIDASVKLVLPPIFRRERSCLYEVVIVA